MLMEFVVDTICSEHGPLDMWLDYRQANSLDVVKRKYVKDKSVKTSN